MVFLKNILFVYPYNNHYNYNKKILINYEFYSKLNTYIIIYFQKNWGILKILYIIGCLENFLRA